MTNEELQEFKNDRNTTSWNEISIPLLQQFTAPLRRRYQLEDAS
jgi:hypothetical protein